jgi:outer membrane protein assembly factor BamB
MDNNSYSGTSSRRLVVMDRRDGRVHWQREARIGFRHGAIVSTKDTLFVIDGLSENAVKHQARRGRVPEEPSVVLALDLQTGKERWRTDSDVFGTFLLYSEDHDILVEGGSQDLRRRLDDEPRKITARRGRDGTILWEGGTLCSARRGPGRHADPRPAGQCHLAADGQNVAARTAAHRRAATTGATAVATAAIR